MTEPAQRRRRDCSSKPNILGKQFTEFGIGTAKGGDGKLYMVQLFRGSATPPKPEGKQGALEVMTVDCHWLFVQGTTVNAREINATRTHQV